MTTTVTADSQLSVLTYIITSYTWTGGIIGQRVPCLPPEEACQGIVAGISHT